MTMGMSMEERLYTLAVCIAVLAIAGLIHLYQKYKKSKEIKRIPSTHVQKNKEVTLKQYTVNLPHKIHEVEEVLTPMENEKEYYACLMKKLDSIEEDMFYHHCKLDHEIFGRITLREFITFNSLVHKKLGIEYDSAYMWDADRDTLVL